MATWPGPAISPSGGSASRAAPSTGSAPATPSGCWHGPRGGDAPAAEIHLREALGTFESIGAEFETARVHLELADLVRARDPAAAREHLARARRVFAGLRAPRYVERADALAATLPPAG
jgi:hypothetical protein